MGASAPTFVCRACPTVWRWKSSTQPDGGEGLAKRKGVIARQGEVMSEGSVEQNRDLTNRNRIGGRPCRTNGQMTVKSISIKGTGCKSGGCAGKAVGLTSGGLHRVPESGLREP